MLKRGRACLTDRLPGATNNQDKAWDLLGCSSRDALSRDQLFNPSQLGCSKRATVVYPVIRVEHVFLQLTFRAFAGCVCCFLLPSWDSD